MALANFFDKINFGASQVLKNHDRSAFEQKLLSNCVAIHFGQDAVSLYEGRCALDLIVRLLSRLYPNLIITGSGISPEHENFLTGLLDLARKINPDVNLANDQQATISVHVGQLTPNRESPTHFIGSDNWKGSHSLEGPLGIGRTLNPFGAAVAACLASANIFRAIFKDELGNPSLDQDVTLSAFSYSTNSLNEEPHIPKLVNLDFTLIGVGAIGNAALWALLQMTQVQGPGRVIDPEEVALSNLQRYMLMTQEHVGSFKVSKMQELFKKNNSGLIIHPLKGRWQEVIGGFSLQQMGLVATAVDTGQDRLLIQSTLPKSILNAWTSPDCLGISRHFDFAEGPCLGCLYLPIKRKLGESEKIAEALGISSQEVFIRQYLANNRVIDQHFVQTIHFCTGISVDALQAFMGKPVRILYSEGICGGRVVTIRNKEGMSQDMEVPLAHESALAGVLLAAEIVIHAARLRVTPIDPLSKMNLAKPIHGYILEKETKHYSGLCFCQDEGFASRYKVKWSA